MNAPPLLQTFTYAEIIRVFHIQFFFFLLRISFMLLSTNPNLSWPYFFLWFFLLFYCYLTDYFSSPPESRRFVHIASFSFYDFFLRGLFFLSFFNSMSTFFHQMSFFRLLFFLSFFPPRPPSFDCRRICLGPNTIYRHSLSFAFFSRWYSNNAKHELSNWTTRSLTDLIYSFLFIFDFILVLKNGWRLFR